MRFKEDSHAHVEQVELDNSQAITCVAIGKSNLIIIKKQLQEDHEQVRLCVISQTTKVTYTYVNEMSFIPSFFSFPVVQQEHYHSGTTMSVQ